ncbi:MAG: NAD(P)H-dependent oxidoreductase subunit E, partial [Clostridia bacterium]|nr:NAD(P)H-dependent oxidoreductase subunit E [Clostridia bacterium]
VKGSGTIIEKIKERLGIDVGQCSADGKFSLNATRCIGACGLAPVMTVNDAVFGQVTPADLDDIFAKYEG